MIINILYKFYNNITRRREWKNDAKGFYRESAADETTNLRRVRPSTELVSSIGRGTNFLSSTAVNKILADGRAGVKKCHKAI